jgi:hypothetical protein
MKFESPVATIKTRINAAATTAITAHNSQAGK